jgi:hypothetical protein
MKRYSGDDIAEAMAEVLGLTKEARIVGMNSLWLLSTKLKKTEIVRSLKD